MELERMILELRAELALLDEAIAHLERLSDRSRHTRAHARPPQGEENQQTKGNSATASPDS